MKCEIVRDNLSAFIDGELAPGLHAEIERHLDECPACAAELDSLMRIVKLVSDLPHVEAPEDVMAEVRDQLARQALLEGSEPRNLRRSRIRFIAFAGSLAAAAVILVVAFISWPALQTGAPMAVKLSPEPAAQPSYEELADRAAEAPSGELRQPPVEAPGAVSPKAAKGGEVGKDGSPDLLTVGGGLAAAGQTVAGIGQQKLAPQTDLAFADTNDIQIVLAVANPAETRRAVQAAMTQLGIDSEDKKLAIADSEMSMSNRGNVNVIQALSRDKLGRMQYNLSQNSISPNESPNVATEADGQKSRSSSQTVNQNELLNKDLLAQRLIAVTASNQQLTFANEGPQSRQTTQTEQSSTRSIAKPSGTGPASQATSDQPTTQVADGDKFKSAVKEVTQREARSSQIVVTMTLEDLFALLEKLDESQWSPSSSSFAKKMASSDSSGQLSERSRLAASFQGTSLKSEEAQEQAAVQTKGVAAKSDASPLHRVVRVTFAIEPLPPTAPAPSK